MSRLVTVLSVLSFLSLAACATGGLASDHDTAARAKVNLHLDTMPALGAEQVFPRAVAPELPSVDRISHQVRAQLGDRATAELDLCVSAQGSVTKVAIARSSSLPAFDNAVLRDAEEWRFESLPGPAAAQSCTRATVAYRAHR
ncbi:MAG: energy transducer TonB [Deltaproteobacteria bacterium]|nr:energy transducer TonB [Deltaproteobacteria bacterium]